MKLSIVIPCYNKVDTIESIVKAVKQCPYQNKEIVLVDDYSTDGTREKLAGEIGNLIDKVICHECNQGKGAALRTGIKAAIGGVHIPAVEMFS